MPLSGLYSSIDHPTVGSVAKFDAKLILYCGPLVLTRHLPHETAYSMPKCGHLKQVIFDAFIQAVSLPLQLPITKTC